MSDMGIGESMLLSSIIGGGASLAGGALANKGKTNSTSTSNNSFNNTSTSMPTIAPGYSPMAQQINDMVMNRLKTGTDLSGYTGTGLSNINRAFSLASQGSDNDLAARGLSTSPIAGAVGANRNLARAATSAQFTNSIPLLQRDLQSQDLDLGSRILSAFGRGQTNTSSGTSTGTNTGETTTESGGGAAGAFNNLSGYLGYLSGSGAFGGNNGFVNPNQRYQVQGPNGSRVLDTGNITGMPGGLPRAQF